MTTMSRWFLNFMSALSLALGLAAAAMWVRSYGWIDEAYWRTGDSILGATSLRGELQFIWEAHLSQPGGGGHRAFSAVGLARGSRSMAQQCQHHCAGFGYDHRPTPVVDMTRIVVPYWFVILPTIILPVWWLKAPLRRRRRRKLGLCLVCGYDLRASPERCPECGTAVPAR